MLVFATLKVIGLVGLKNIAQEENISTTRLMVRAALNALPVIHKLGRLEI
jgi:hypothetical protein